MKALERVVSRQRRKLCRSYMASPTAVDFWCRTGDVQTMLSDDIQQHKWQNVTKVTFSLHGGAWTRDEPCKILESRAGLLIFVRSCDRENGGETSWFSIILRNICRIKNVTHLYRDASRWNWTISSNIWFPLGRGELRVCVLRQWTKADDWTEASKLEAIQRDRQTQYETIILGSKKRY